MGGTMKPKSGTDVGGTAEELEERGEVYSIGGSSGPVECIGGWVFSRRWRLGSARLGLLVLERRWVLGLFMGAAEGELEDDDVGVQQL